MNWVLRYSKRREHFEGGVKQQTPAMVSDLCFSGYKGADICSEQSTEKSPITFVADLLREFKEVIHSRSSVREKHRPCDDDGLFLRYLLLEYI